MEPSSEAFSRLVLPAVAELARQRVVPLLDGGVVSLSVYSDGTGGSPGTLGAAGLAPAWGVVVVAKHADGSQALVGAAGGSLQSVPGVDVCGSTSHAAEGVGALWALLWIIAAVHDEGFPLVSHCSLV